MENNYRQALTEVLEVLNHTDKNIIKRIPKELAIFLLKNQDKQYKPQIDFSLDNWETLLKNETQALLAYIYKEYIVDENEKNALLNEENMIQKGEEILKKYGAEDLFNNNDAPKYNVTEQTEQNVPIAINSEPWHKKLLKKIINIFKK